MIAREKIAIIGMGPGRADAPYGDWVCWALFHDVFARVRADILFEMHEMPHLEKRGVVETAEELDAPIYWQHPSSGKFWEYPLKRVIEDIGRDWFGSSIAYMIALAIHKRAETIGVWGVHMLNDDEYLHQRPNLSWLLGIAEGRGIKVHISEDSALMRYSGPYPVRYGYL